MDREIESAARSVFYFGNAKADDVRGSGWFVGQFVPPELGLRHQKDVELKWGVHRNGDKRSSPGANGNGTTIAILLEGSLALTFDVAGEWQRVVLKAKGDYVVFGPDVVHSWEAIGATYVLSVRFPSVEVQSRPPTG